MDVTARMTAQSACLCSWVLSSDCKWYRERLRGVQVAIYRDRWPVTVLACWDNVYRYGVEESLLRPTNKSIKDKSNGNFIRHEIIFSLRFRCKKLIAMVPEVKIGTFTFYWQKPIPNRIFKAYSVRNFNVKIIVIGQASTRGTLADQIRRVAQKASPPNNHVKLIFSAKDRHWTGSMIQLYYLVSYQVYQSPHRI